MVHGDNKHDHLVALVDLEPSHQMDGEAVVLGRLRAEAQAKGLHSYKSIAGVTFASRPPSRGPTTRSAAPTS